MYKQLTTVYLCVSMLQKQTCLNKSQFLISHVTKGNHQKKSIHSSLMLFCHSMNITDLIVHNYNDTYEHKQS